MKTMNYSIIRCICALVLGVLLGQRIFLVGKLSFKRIA